jgi:hypothetical protein
MPGIAAWRLMLNVFLKSPPPGVLLPFTSHHSTTLGAAFVMSWPPHEPLCQLENQALPAPMTGAQLT